MARRCTRRIEFDAAHRVLRHESKCRNLHGHRYVADITVEADELDSVGRVVDFSAVKERVGGWVDQNWDHGCILSAADVDLAGLCRENGWRLYLLTDNPTAEHMAAHLFASAEGLMPEGIRVVAVRLYETPSCWVDYP